MATQPSRRFARPRKHNRRRRAFRFNGRKPWPPGIHLHSQTAHRQKPGQNKGRKPGRVHGEFVRQQSTPRRQTSGPENWPGGLPCPRRNHHKNAGRFADRNLPGTNRHNRPKKLPQLPKMPKAKPGHNYWIHSPRDTKAKGRHGGRERGRTVNDFDTAFDCLAGGFFLFFLWLTIDFCGLWNWLCNL